MAVSGPRMLVAERFKVRPMTLADIPQVVEVEHESFPTTWPQTAYRRELSSKIARYIVLVDNANPLTRSELQGPRRSILRMFRRREEEPASTDRVVGYVGMWLMVDQAHIVAIAVRERYRGQGLGELLLAQAVQVAIDSNVESVTLEVRRSNAPAQALYEKYRFLKVAVRARYYSDNHEDAIIMTTPPIQDPAYAEHLRYLKEAYRQRWDREI
ncbi:MAG TPA: ribosomal protein S18-alanine N-acetyltransferase [Dehalococcoidia bacterium]|nr:ribosomal protein S18-alanine N-acetyltransferase [Dehalococcoidia bacterium]